jgi:hypothetical protein
MTNIVLIVLRPILSLDVIMTKKLLTEVVTKSKKMKK